MHALCNTVVLESADVMFAHAQGNDNHWIQIQQSTFCNWINAQLQQVDDLSVDDLQHDFCDGIKLCALIETLQVRVRARACSNVITLVQKSEILMAFNTTQCSSSKKHS